MRATYIEPVLPFKTKSGAALYFRPLHRGTDPSIPYPRQRLNLLNLPLELLCLILEYTYVDIKNEYDHPYGNQLTHAKYPVIGNEAEFDNDDDNPVRKEPLAVDLTISKYKRRCFDFGRRFPIAIDRFSGLLKASEVTRMLIPQAIGRKFHFRSLTTEPLGDLGWAFGRANCLLIRTLEMPMDEYAAGHPDKAWPELLSVLCDLAKNLEWFKMYIPRYNTGNFIKATRCETASEQQAVYSPVLLFMALLVQRHEKLDRLIRPADSGVKNQDGLCRVYLIADAGQRWGGRTTQDREWNKYKLAVHPAIEQRKAIEDAVLDTKKILRTPFNQLKHSPIGMFVIDSGANQTCDELLWTKSRMSMDYYYLIEERAFRTKAYHHKHQWQFRSYKQLLRLCQRLENGMAGKEDVVALAEGPHKKLKVFKKDRRGCKMAKGVPDVPYKSEASRALVWI